MHIKIHGTPAGQGSKTRGANGSMREASKALPAWREAIRAEVQRGMGAHPLARAFTGAVEITVELTLPRPLSQWRRRNGELVDELRPNVPLYPVGKPDVDKLLRAVNDGLVAGGALADDALIVVESVKKIYAGFGEPAGCEVWIDALTTGPAVFKLTDPSRDALEQARAFRNLPPQGAESTC